MLSRRLTSASRVAAFLAAAMSIAGSANATALYWTKTPVKTASVEVAGSRAGVYAAITCFSTAPRATAIAMAAGDNLAATRQLSEDLQRKIAGIQIID